MGRRNGDAALCLRVMLVPVRGVFRVLSRERGTPGQQDCQQAKSRARQFRHRAIVRKAEIETSETCGKRKGSHLRSLPIKPGYEIQVSRFAFYLSRVSDYTRVASVLCGYRS